MSKRGKKYTADFKTKVILELLEGEQALDEICSKHEVTPKTVKEWKATFPANASLAFIESKLDNLSVVKQCELLGLNRSSFY